MDGNVLREDTGGDDSSRLGNKSVTGTSSWKEHHADIPGALLDSIAIIFALSSSSGDEPSGDVDVGGDFKKDYPADILFSWPKKSKSRTVGALLECQGMFTTLFRLLQDVMWSVPSVSHVRVNETDTDVCYASDKEGAGILLVAFGPTDPAYRIPASVLQRFTNKLFTAITFKYGSLTRAFGNAAENETGRLLSNAVSSFLNHPAECLLAIETLPRVRSIPLDVIQQIEEIMYSLECKNSADEDAEVYSTGNESLSNFYCIGSLVLCKGTLVASHLEEQLQHQLCSWIATELNHLDLIESATASERIVKWQPVYSNCHGDLHEDHNCRHYAVLVGLEGLLLTFLLESIQILPRVLPQDDLWMKAGVEAAMQLLCLNIAEHILKGRHVEGEGNKSPSHSNKGYNNSIQKSLKNRASQDMLNKAEQDPQFNSDEFELSADLKQSLQSLTDKLSSISDRKDGHGDSGTTTGSDASSSKLSMDGSETVSSHRGNFLSSHVLRQSIPTNVIMRENCVYCFLMVDYGRGVLVAHEEEAHHISHQLMTNFRLHARTTHEILRKAKNSRETLSRRAGNHRWASKAIAPVTEHGTLFTCSPPDPPGQRYKKKVKKINYWLVGRLYDEHREVFVCLQDTVANESVREIAFKMALSDGHDASV